MQNLSETGKKAVSCDDEPNGTFSTPFYAIACLPRHQILHCSRENHFGQDSLWQISSRAEVVERAPLSPTAMEKGEKKLAGKERLPRNISRAISAIIVNALL
jgi:hypothetical protein